ncbi:MAG: hypothetical protein V1944_01920 [Candidatus Aenigmatarchaeota archaeon]
MIEIGRVFEYWTRWKDLEVTPNTAPYFRANKSLYEERLKKLQDLADEIVLDNNIPKSYQDSLSQQVFNSIIVIGRPNRNEAEELVNYALVFAGGVTLGAIGKDILK